MKRLLILAVSASFGFGLVLFSTPAQSLSIAPPVPPAPVDTTGAPLNDGDLITSFVETDPDIFIINLNGFGEQDTAGLFRTYNGAKRLFLNPRP